MAPPPPLPPRNAPRPRPPPPPRPPSPSRSTTSEESDPSSPPRHKAETLHLMPYGRSPSPSPSLADTESDGPPPAYEEQWGGGDPRSSSMHSLLPAESQGSDRRTLLMIYIHGFMGNETSFKSFPAHVHNLLTVTMAETHVVHTKIYPRYQSRRSMDFARDNFSNWLTPHESPTTDVILLGHSIGGILAAEVALLQSYSENSPNVYQHRILGVIAFDTPFLGMHPGVIGTGIASLFRPAPEIPGLKPDTDEPFSPSESDGSSLQSPAQSFASDLFSTTSNDPNFNPSFANDILKPKRKGLEKALYFLNKHSDGLTKAAKEYFTSHLEFGGVLADYPGMKTRYVHMRALEDVDELAQRKDPKGRPLRRVRFVNYYSASTGRFKAPKSPKAPASKGEDSLEKRMTGMTLASTVSEGGSSELTTHSTTSSLSVEERSEDEETEKAMEELDPMPMDELDPMPVEEEEEDDKRKGKEGGKDEEKKEEMEDHNSENLLQQTTGRSETEELDKQKSSSQDSSENLRRQSTDRSEIEDLGKQNSNSQGSSGKPATLDEIGDAVDELPPIPPLPEAPPDFDSSKYTAKDTLKVAQKEHARLVKAYERAKKDREKSLRDREKLIQKREKEAAKQVEKGEREKTKQLEKEEREKAKQVEKEEREKGKQLEKEEREKAKQLEKEERERTKQLEREEKERAKQLEKEAKLTKKTQEMEENERLKRAATLNPETYDDAIRDAESTGMTEQQARKNQRDRKFCTLPSKDPKTGLRDSTWIRVYMEGVDEVVAHVTLFIPGETYEKLVGDVTARVEEWVKEDATKRMVLEEMGKN